MRIGLIKLKKDKKLRVVKMSDLEKCVMQSFVEMGYVSKINLDDATNEQLDYAVGIAQWELLPVQKHFNERAFKKENGDVLLVSQYHPTSSQAQCFDLIQRHKVLCEWNAESGDSSLDMWYCGVYESCFFDINESLNLAVVKAVLLSKYQDGIIPIKEG